VPNDAGYNRLQWSNRDKNGFHHEGISNQTRNEIEGRATQIIIDPQITDKYKTTQLEVSVGDVLIFDEQLAYKSGHNSTKDEVRFSLVGMWNDIDFKGFRAPLPKFTPRTILSKEYYDQHFSKR